MWGVGWRGVSEVVTRMDCGVRCEWTRCEELFARRDLLGSLAEFFIICYMVYVWGPSGQDGLIYT